MAAAFRPVNSSLTGTTESTAENVMSPNSSSLRPRTAPHSQHPHSSDQSATSTRTTFNGSSMAGQQPLPYAFSQAAQARESSEGTSRRDTSQRAAKSPPRTSKDVDMDGSDGETATVEENPGSDDESVNADGSRSSKKKKSQRFYCTDYPPCNLSFTRSEHLARHIRKHTGERPFKCHCQRRFSRLDNLRQHAQTVHVNENIPVDSLAATGSRFQRQIRTDRARQAGNRARASTGGSAGGPARGHSKSLSTPNIPTMASVGPAYSTQVDPRQRPTPIVMATDPRSRLSFDSYRSSFGGTLPFPQYSPDRFTPPSGFAAAQTSPRRGPYSMSSSSHSRSQSLYSIDNRPPSRRLSVPSGSNPFQMGHGQLPPGRSSFGPALINSPSAGALPSPNSGMMPSPTMPSADWSSRRDSISSVGDEALRRRTWHIETGGPTGYPISGISEDVRPDLLPPITRPSSPIPRLPGIASLVSIPRRPATPPRQQQQQHLSAMEVDAQVQRPIQMEPLQTDERRNLNMYDVSLQRGLGRLDIGPRTPPRENAGAWIPETSRAAHTQQSDRAQMNTSTVRFEEQPHPSYHAHPSGLSGGRSLHSHTMSAPNLVPSRENRRHGWYHGSASYENGQPSQQELRGPHVDRMLHPNLNGFSGFPAKDQPSQMQQQERPNNSDPLRRLEALVAVATSEGSTATAY